MRNPQAVFPIIVIHVADGLVIQLPDRVEEQPFVFGQTCRTRPSDEPLPG
jgi:hypothetical protein